MKTVWILGFVLALGACGVKGAPMPKKDSEYIGPSRVQNVNSTNPDLEETNLEETNKEKPDDDPR